ncbi:MAG: energy transducer TonB [Marinospirillum sp.]|uniref:energy transducer TonB n=1 Tax=Marinospirillum sp. TaxID=2183934 RepID=UPI001A0F05AF|nr:energy transducer TonB [Marinospirillum sp.]MBE0505111.1 energy transducer TonB [Marinospirillum sp.]
MNVLQGLLSLRPILWALLLALLLHAGVLFINTRPSESPTPELEQIYLEATAVYFDDEPLSEPLAEPDLPSDPQPTPELAPEVPAPEPDVVPPAKDQQQEADIEPQPELEAAAPETPLPPVRGASLIARSLEIARLESELATQQAVFAERPRVRRISTNAVMTTEEALYLRQWEERVERIGNLNYPEEARRQNLGGRLRLLVVINADGSILEAQLMTSSGHRLLDDAAIRILNLASPFAPLPDSVRAKADVLEIIRTWQFGDGWRAN